MIAEKPRFLSALNFVLIFILSGSISFAGDPRTGDAKHVSIQPLLTSPGKLEQMDSRDLPEKLQDDEKWLVEHESDPADLPVILIRCNELPNAVWVLRLPEMGIMGAQGRTGYQTKYLWKSSGTNSYYYDWHPITGGRLEAGPLLGKVRCQVAVNKLNEVEFSIDYVNEAEKAWSLPMVWVCLLQRYAGKGVSYYWSEQGLRTTHSVTNPKSTWLNFLPVKGQERFIEAHKKWEDYTIVSGIASKRELVWRSTVKPNFEVKIGSEQAGMFGWSMFWPCTDMGLLVDEILPGEQATYKGYVRLGSKYSNSTSP